MPFSRKSSSQATFTTDFDSLMDVQSGLDHWARSLLQFAAYAIDQTPRRHQFRLNKEKFLESISCVVDGVRCCASPWPLGPGWDPKDAQVGKVYSEDFDGMTEAQLIEHCNADGGSVYPYGRKEAHDHTIAWRAHQSAMTKTIALCAAADIDEKGDVQANPNKRRCGWRSSVPISRSLLTYMLCSDN